MRVVIIDSCNENGDLTIRAVVEKPIGKSRDDVFLAWYRRNVNGSASEDEVTGDHEKFNDYTWREKEVTEWSTI